MAAQPPLPFRCANCRVAVGESPPDRCLVCKTSRFETYQPIRGGKQQLAIVAGSVLAYMFTTWYCGATYDPLWVCVGSLLTGQLPCASFFWIISLVLIAGMFSWLFYPHPYCYLLGLFSLALWYGFAFMVRAAVYA